MERTRRRITLIDAITCLDRLPVVVNGTDLYWLLKEEILILVPVRSGVEMPFLHLLYGI